MEFHNIPLKYLGQQTVNVSTPTHHAQAQGAGACQEAIDYLCRRKSRKPFRDGMTKMVFLDFSVADGKISVYSKTKGEKLLEKKIEFPVSAIEGVGHKGKRFALNVNHSSQNGSRENTIYAFETQREGDDTVLLYNLLHPPLDHDIGTNALTRMGKPTTIVSNHTGTKMLGSISSDENGTDTGYMHVGGDEMDDAWDPTAEPESTRFGYNFSTGTTNSVNTFQTARSSDGAINHACNSHENDTTAAHPQASLDPPITSAAAVMSSRAPVTSGDGATFHETLMTQMLEAQNALLRSQLRVSELERDKEGLRREALELKSEMASLAADMATDLADIKHTMLDDATNRIAGEMSIVKSALGVLALKMNTVMAAVLPHRPPPATTEAGPQTQPAPVLLSKRPSEDAHSVDSGLSAGTGSHGADGGATADSAGKGDGSARDTQQTRLQPHGSSASAASESSDVADVQRRASLAAFWAEVTQEGSSLMVPEPSAQAVNGIGHGNQGDAASSDDNGASAYANHDNTLLNHSVTSAHNASTSSRMLNLVKRLSSFDSSRLASQRTTSESDHLRSTEYYRRGSGSSVVSSDVLAAKDNEISYHKSKAEQLERELATRAVDVDTLHARVEQLTKQMLVNEPGGERKIRNGLMRRSVVLVPPADDEKSDPLSSQAPPRTPPNVPTTTEAMHTPPDATTTDEAMYTPPDAATTDEAMHTPPDAATIATTDIAPRGGSSSNAAAATTAKVRSWLQDTHAHTATETHPEAEAAQSPRAMAAALAAELAKPASRHSPGAHDTTSPGCQSDHAGSFALDASATDEPPEQGVMSSPEVIMQVGVPVPNGASLGVCITGGTDEPVSSGDPSIYVTNLVHGGAVHRDGRVLQGDKILAVDGVSLVGVTHETALHILRRAAGGSDDDGCVVVLSLARVPVEDFYEICIDCTDDPRGLGIEVAPAEYDGKGIFISRIAPDGSAAQCDHLAVGDRIVIVEGVPLLGKTVAEARELLAACANTMATLAIARVHESFLDDASSPGGNTTSLSQQTTIVEDVLEISFAAPEGVGLGVTIVGGTDNPVHPGDTAVYVTAIVPGSAAELDGRLRVGDRIIEINEVNTVAVTQETAIRALKQHKTGVKLIVSRLPVHEEELLTIDFDVGPNGLGFSIYGGVDQHGADNPGIVVLRLTENGSAALDGRLQPGDLLLEANGESLENKTHDAASALLAQITGHITLTVARLTEKKIAQEIFVDIKLEMPPDCPGVGFSIAGGVDDPIEEGDTFIYVTHIIEGGFTHLDGQIRFGDKIIQVNGVDLTATTHYEAINVIANARGTIFIRVARLPGEDEEEEDILQVEFSAAQQKLGMQIEGGSDDPVDSNDPGIYIAAISRDGAAAADGRLRVGDKLLVCNGINLNGVTHGEAIRTLKTHLDDLKLTISRTCIQGCTAIASSVSPIDCD
eukprot:m.1223856 g.1223856  ORF g.1223856 m.1223856 type:complete len:1436 (+) comp24626_c0_seq13:242-4549(+)